MIYRQDELKIKHDGLYYEKQQQQQQDKLSDGYKQAKKRKENK